MSLSPDSVTFHCKGGTARPSQETVEALLKDLAKALPMKAKNTSFNLKPLR